MRSEYDSPIYFNKIKYFQYEPHSAVSMFSYQPYEKYIKQYFEPTTHSSFADIMIATYSIDFYNHGGLSNLYSKINNLFVLCEEPLWNKFSSFYKGHLFSQKHYDIKREKVNIPVTELNYKTSDIFSYETVPYFLTTNEKYIKNHKKWLAISNQTGINKIIGSHSERKYKIGGLFSHRTKESYRYDKFNSNPCLSSIRTKIAENLLKINNDNIFIGENWKIPNLSSTIYNKNSWKQALWHEEKLDWATSNVRMLYAVENTSTPNYVTEKIFDAVISNSIPIYYMKETEFFYDKIKGINLYNFDLERMVEDIDYCKQIFEGDINYEEIITHNFNFANTFFDNIERKVDKEIEKRVRKLYKHIKREMI